MLAVDLSGIRYIDVRRTILRDVPAGSRVFVYHWHVAFRFLSVWLGQNLVRSLDRFRFRRA